MSCIPCLINPFQSRVKQSLYLFRAVFWVVLPCRMIVDRRFRGAYCLHHQGWWTSYSPPWELEISQSLYLFLTLSVTMNRSAERDETSFYSATLKCHGYRCLPPTQGRNANCNDVRTICVSRSMMPSQWAARNSEFPSGLLPGGYPVAFFLDKTA
jgi:hypothetical protein